MLGANSEAFTRMQVIGPSDLVSVAGCPFETDFALAKGGESNNTHSR